MDKKLLEFSWMIGGPQGSGVDSSANTFAQVMARAGYFIYGKREYHSNIKGAHSYFQIICSIKPVNSHIDGVHMLSTFEEETLHLHTFEVFKNGSVIVDTEYTGEINRDDILIIRMPYVKIIKDIATKFGEKDTMKLMVMKNVISVAASLGLIGINFKHLEKTLNNIFSGRKAKLAPMNIDCARISYEYAKQYSKDFMFRLEDPPQDFINKRVLVTGNTTIAIAKIAAGCRFQSYYPITPASDESVYLEEHPEYGIVVVQTEDEISAITSAIGAAIAGARSSTSTSGPGFSLMAEGLGWAGMNEVPVVVVNYQRGGPSTGLPTRNEQGDMLFAIHTGHGEFPRIVMAPGDIQEAFYDTLDAFNYAEKYQSPVILLADRAIANAIQTVPVFNPKNTKIERGKIATYEELLTYEDDNNGFKRFLFTESGVSPRVFPGTEKGIHWLTGDEHDEIGHITEDPKIRSMMHAKRMKKLDLIEKEIPYENKLSLYGFNDAEIIILSWGSTKGAILDAIEPLKQSGIKVKFLQIRILHPFPKNEVKEIMDKAKKIIVVENNYTSQLKSLIKENMLVKPDHYLLKWTGRPISRTEIIHGVEKVVTEKIERLELKYGV